MKYNNADNRLIRVGDAYEYWKNKADTVPKYNDAKILRDMLDEVPAAKPGHWMETENKTILECSYCHSRWNIYYVTDFNYCPCCGAKMERDIG